MNLKIVLVAFGRPYLDEALLCLKTIRNNGEFNGEVYIITNVFETTIEHAVKIYINEYKYSADNIIGSGFKLKILDLIPYEENDVFLYLDSDILVLKKIELPDPKDKVCVYGYPGRILEEISFAGFITDDPKIIHQPAFCSGIFLFRPTKEIKETFKNTWNDYEKNYYNKNFNGCWEQPFLTYHLTKDKLSNICLNDFVYEERSNVEKNEKNMFNHLCGLRGIERKRIMKKYIISTN